MVTFLLVIGYIFCFCVSLFLLTSAWRFDFDVAVGDFIFLIVMSLLGPVSLVSSAIIYLIQWSDSRPESDTDTEQTILFQKFDRRE